MPTLTDMGLESLAIVILAIVLPLASYTALLVKHRNNDDV
jgi:hypothetical protein